MQNKNALTWTAIPVSLTKDGCPLVSIYLSPRLAVTTDADLPLSKFPDFADWPQTACNLTFTLEFCSLDDEKPTSMETEILSKPDSTLWRALFPETVRVKSYDRGKDGRLEKNYESDAVKKTAQYIHQSYLNLAERSLTNLFNQQSTDSRTRAASLPGFPVPRPTNAELSEQFEDANLFLPQTPTEQQKQEVAETMDPIRDWARENWEPDRKSQEFLGRLVPSLKDETIDVRTLFKASVIKSIVKRMIKEMGLNSAPAWEKEEEEQAAGVGGLTLDDHINRAHFHRPLPLVCPKPVVEEKPEFHSLIAMLGSHPLLYSHLGLVFDVVGKSQIPRSEIGRIRVTPTVSLSDPADHIRPLTAYQVFDCAQSSGSGKKRLFLPCSRSNGAAEAQQGRSADEDTVQMGLLDLTNKDHFHLEMLDTHGAHFKTSHLDSSGAPESPADPKQETAAVPKLRSTGLSLVRTGRGAKVQAAAATNKKHLQDLGKTTFYAEDLTIGYRVDVCTLPESATDASQGTWRALCLRNTTWKLTAGQVPWRPRVMGDGRKAQVTDDRTSPTPDYDQVEARRLEGVIHSAAARPIDGATLNSWKPCSPGRTGVWPWRRQQGAFRRRSTMQKGSRSKPLIQYCRIRCLRFATGPATISVVEPYF
jgi:hypothetical protein